MSSKEKKGRTKKTPKKSADEGIKNLKPDMIITISGKTQVGKDVVASLIAGKLKSKPLGYSVYLKESNTNIEVIRKAKKGTLHAIPVEWDERTRKVLIQTDISMPE